MRLIPFLLLAPLLITACGQDFCERSAAQAEECGEPISDEDLQACEEGLDKCSGDDKDLLNDFYDCMDNAGFFECEDTESGTTTTASTTGFESLGDLFACIFMLENLSEECQGGLDMDMGFGSGSTSTSTFSPTTTSGR